MFCLGKSEVLPEPLTTTETIYFSETAVRSPGTYRLVYIAQRGDIIGILGMSSAFPCIRRPGP